MSKVSVPRTSEQAMRAVLQILESTRPGRRQTSTILPTETREDAAAFDVTNTIGRACGRLKVTAKLLDALPSNYLKDMDQDDLSWFFEMLSGEITDRVAELERARIAIERAGG